MTRVSQRDVSHKLVWTGTIASPVSMFSARRLCGRPRRRGDGAHYTPIASADVFAYFCLRTWTGERANPIPR